MTKDYKTIAEELQAAFPEGTLQKGKSVHIPVQAYIRRLEDAAEGLWSWRLVEYPAVLEQEQAVMVRGELSIDGAVRSGVGCSFYVRDNSSRSVSSFKNAVSAAESDAIRNACDKFLMGWIDLAPHRDWGKNPGVALQPDKENKNLSKRVCKRCGKHLLPEDELYLELHSIRLPFCSDHVPTHLQNK